MPDFCLNSIIRRRHALKKILEVISNIWLKEHKAFLIFWQEMVFFLPKSIKLTLNKRLFCGRFTICFEMFQINMKIISYQVINISCSLYTSILNFMKSQDAHLMICSRSTRSQRSVSPPVAMAAISRNTSTQSMIFNQVLMCCSAPGYNQIEIIIYTFTNVCHIPI